jgi:anti-sigma factor RsiW
MRWKGSFMTCEDIAPLCSLYVSGELDPPRALAFAEHLRACRACAAEIERRARLDALLRDTVLSEPIDSAALEQRVRARILSERRFSRARGLALAAGLGAILLAGAFGYRSLFPAKPPRIFADAAQDHRNEIALRQHRTWLSDPKPIADLAARNKIPPSLVTALAPPGYRLLEAKLCRLDGRVFLHLVYARGARQFSTYLRALDARPLPGPTRETVNGKLLHEAGSGREHVASFQTAKLTALFVTDQSSAAALSFARFAARLL